MLSDEVIAAIAEELAEADRTHGVIPRITARYPDATIEDSYAIQGVWRDRNIAAGRRLVGRKIGLTSKAMQQATGISEPDYGVMFDDTVYESGAEIPVDLFSNVRIEVELAFVLKEPLEGPDCTLDDALRAIDYAVPALEVLNSHIELEGRTIVDTISDNAAYGAHGARRDAQAPRRDRPALGARRCSPATARSRRPGSPRACSATPPPASRGSRTSSTSTAPASRPARSSSPARSPARCGCRAETACMRLWTDGGHHMPLLLAPTFRERSRSRPAARRDVGVHGLAARRRDLRGRRPGLAADRHGALPQRARVRAGAAAGGGRLPGHAGGARARSATP